MKPRGLECTLKVNVRENHAGLHSAVGSASDCRSTCRKFESQHGHMSLVEIYHEIISKAIGYIGPVPRNQERQLSVTGENMRTSTVRFPGYLDLGRTKRKCVFGICEQRRPRSACASTQSEQGLHSPLTESFDTIECVSGKQMHGLDFTHVKDDVNPHILRMFEGTFSFDLANLHYFLI